MEIVPIILSPVKIVGAGGSLNEEGSMSPASLANSMQVRIMLIRVFAFVYFTPNVNQRSITSRIIFELVQRRQRRPDSCITL